LTARRSRDLLVLGITLAVLAADQISKYWVRYHLEFNVPWNPLPWLRPILSFTYVSNTGVAFGFFQGLNWLYTLVTIAVIGLVLHIFRHLPARHNLLLVSQGLILGGASGNLVDRLWLGRVVDFLDLNFWPLQEWPVFNVADSCVVVGVCVLAVYLLFEQGPSPVSSDAPDQGK